MSAPDIQVIPLGSGSKGNCTFVGTPKGALLIDAGFSAKETLRRLAQVGADPASIQAILITHEHSDHVGNLGPLSRALKVPVHITRGTLHALKSKPVSAELKDVIPVTGGERFRVGDIQIDPFLMPHDATEPVAYAMEWGGRRWAQVTDFGAPTQLVIERIRRCDLLLLEANHDEEMLLNGPYPWPLKQRVRGRFGHLSNTQSVTLLEQVLHADLKALALMHLSEVNNKPELPYALFRRRLDSLGAGHIPVQVAEQRTPLLGMSLKSL